MRHRGNIEAARGGVSGRTSGRSSPGEVEVVADDDQRLVRFTRDDGFQSTLTPPLLSFAPESPHSRPALTRRTTRLRESLFTERYADLLDRLSAGGPGSRSFSPVPLFQTRLATGTNALGYTPQYAVSRDEPLPAQHRH
jgi:hypothetical protein